MRESRILKPWDGHFQRQKIRQINLGTEGDPKRVKLNAALESNYAKDVEALLREFKDVFVWLYKELKVLPAHIAEYRIELDTSMPPCHQERYHMNPNYAAIVKQYLDNCWHHGLSNH